MILKLLKNSLSFLLRRSIVRFGLVGFLGFGVGTYIFYLFVDILSYNSTLFLCITFVYISIQNYILDKFWVFKNREKSKSQFFKFFANSLLSFGINLGLFHLLKYLIDFSLETAYSIISTSFGALVNYFLAKKFVFKSKSRNN